MFEPAHPRSRGENDAREVLTDSGPGSSPLARGKLSDRDEGTVVGGLIPARAGKTVGDGAHDVLLRAHPRSRGENDKLVDEVQKALGSSPLARGKRGDSCCQPDGGGLIPARAGKTVITPDGNDAPKAHPRSRGENVVVSTGSAWRFGSSPLARGKPPTTAREEIVRRLIPARAGKTCATVSKSSSVQAHPRSRGENGSTSKRTSP